MTNNYYDFKEYLYQTRNLRNLIESEIKKLDMLRTLSTSVHVDVTTERVMKSKKIDSFEETVIKIVEREKVIKNNISLWLEKISFIEQLIDGVENNTYKIILNSRYICDMKWEEIAKEYHYELSWVYRLHQRALKALYSSYLNYFDKQVKASKNN